MSYSYMRLWSLTMTWIFPDYSLLLILASIQQILTVSFKIVCQEFAAAHPSSSIIMTYTPPLQCSVSVAYLSMFPYDLS